VNLDIPKLLVVLVLGAAGAYLLVRATQGGGPIYYFISAVCLGMAVAAFQGRGGPGGRSRPAKGRGDQRPQRDSGSAKGGRGR